MRPLTRLIVGLLFLFAMFSSVAASAEAKSYVNDHSFGANGLVTGKVGPVETSSTLGARVFAADSQGRTIVGAASGGEWFVWRFLPNGRPDSSFGDQGKIEIADWGYVDWEGSAVLTSAVVRPNGRILLVGYVGSYPVGVIRKGSAWFVMKQLMPDGSPDLTFGQNGGRSFGMDRGAVRAALRPDGSFLVAAFKQLRQSGRTDDAALYSFSAGGRVIRDFGPGENVDSVNVLGAPRKPSYFFDVELLPDGRILVSGTNKNRLFLMRLLSDGSRDRSFGRGGQVSWLPPGNKTFWATTRDMELDRKGRIVLAGSVDPRDPSDAAYGLVLRFSRNGRFDRSFGTNGVVRLFGTPMSGVGRRTSLYGVSVDSWGGIWVTGSAGKVAPAEREAVVVRYETNGRKDSAFFRKGVLRIGLGEGSVGTGLLRVGPRIYMAGRYYRGSQERFFLKRFRVR